MEHSGQLLLGRTPVPTPVLRTLQDLVPGDHLCCIFENEEEHAALLAPFLQHGIAQGQKVVYIAQDHSREAILRYLEADQDDLDRLLASGQFSVVSPADTYLREGAFDPDKMINFLRAETDRAVTEGYSALRATGEMSWSRNGAPGSERLIEYEAKLNNFFPGSKCLALCQYDRRRFDSATLLNVLVTHPLAIIGTNLYDNFYFIPPEEFLGADVPDATLRHCFQNLSFRKQLEEALQSARDEWLHIFDCLSDGISIHDTEYNFRFTNRAFLGFFPEASRRDMKCYEVVHGRTSPHPECPLARSLRTGRTEQSEFFEPTVGRHLWVRCDPVIDAEGRITSFVHAARDITVLKRAQEEIQKSREELEQRVRLRTAEIDRAYKMLQEEVRQRTQAEEELRRLNRVHSVTSAINQAIVRLQDPQRLFDEACRIAVEVGQFRLAWVGLVDPATRSVRPVACAGNENGYLKNIRISIDDVPEGRGPTGTAIRMGTHFVSNDIARDDRMIPWREQALARGFRSCGAFALHSDNSVLGAINLYAAEPHLFDRDEVLLLDELAADISFSLHSIELDHRHAEAVEALRRSEDRHRRLIENSAYAIFHSTLDGRILDANPALVRMLGYDSLDDLPRLSLSQDIYREPSRRDSLIEQIRRTGNVQGVEVEWKRKDGKSILVRFSGRLLFDPATGAEVLETFAEDITERHAMQKQIAALQKFEAIGKLAGGIAHDFNNVIGAVMGWAELGQGLVSDDSPLASYFQKIYDQAQRAAGLTSQLLAFARRQVLDARNLDVNESVREVTKLLETLIGETIEIKLELGEDLPVVRADPTQLSQVLMNLCLNARDAMSQGGQLRIETQVFEVSGEFVRSYTDARPGPHVVLSVTDTGVGMDATTLDHIFEPFFTTKPSGHGTGLGLATVYGIIRQHGGFITVYSEPGHGTTFRVYLPVAAGAVRQKENLVAQEVRGGTETILVAEDHESLREAAREALSRLGYTVLLAHDGDEAVRTFRSQRERIALVVLDVVMPHLSGPQAYAQMTALTPDLPAIFATGYTTEVAALGSFDKSRTTLLQKPYDTMKLARSVRNLLDGAC